MTSVSFCFCYVGVFNTCVLCLGSSWTIWNTLEKILKIVYIYINREPIAVELLNCNGCTVSRKMWNVYYMLCLLIAGGVRQPIIKPVLMQSFETGLLASVFAIFSWAFFSVLISLSLYLSVLKVLAKYASMYFIQWSLRFSSREKCFKKYMFFIK